jgi:hypothetical protein
MKDLSFMTAQMFTAQMAHQWQTKGTSQSLLNRQLS